MASVPDKAGNERLVGSYMKIKPPLDAYKWGLCVWDEMVDRYADLKTIWERSDDAPNPPPVLDGHPVEWSDADGAKWLLFGNPFPTIRCPATFEAWADPATWEALEPQRELRDPDGKKVVPHSGSVAWNPWRKRWVAVFMEKFGKPSAFGELWYAEADAPTGPWVTAVKVASHENYTFYNPRIHPEFTAADSPVLIFEATFTQQFADDPAPVARYDYNQVLYRLDLDDEALAPARKTGGAE